MTFSETWELTGEKLVICEGDHSKFFLQSLFKAHNLNSFQVGHAYECNGKKAPGRSGFGLAIKGLHVFETFYKLQAIVIVTDNDRPDALGIVERDLSRNGYVASETRCVGKFRGKPLVVVLVPDHNNYGNLETLCLPVLYSTWPSAKECVRAYLGCTGALQWANNKELDKARVRAAIAGYFQEDPYKGVGHLFQKGILPANHPQFENLANIFRRLDEIIKNGRFWLLLSPILFRF